MGKNTEEIKLINEKVKELETDVEIIKSQVVELQGSSKGTVKNRDEIKFNNE
jgi:hypothetical protein